MNHSCLLSVKVRLGCNLAKLLVKRPSRYVEVLQSAAKDENGTCYDFTLSGERKPDGLLFKMWVKCLLVFEDIMKFV